MEVTAGGEDEEDQRHSGGNGVDDEEIRERAAGVGWEGELGFCVAY